MTIGSVVWMQVYSLCGGMGSTREEGDGGGGGGGGAGGGAETPVVTPVNTRQVQQMSQR